MTYFFWCLENEDKEEALKGAVHCVRESLASANVFMKDSKDFKDVPGAAFSYWAPDSAIRGFTSLGRLETDKRIARSTNDSGDDFRFIRAWWEINTPKFSFLEWRPLCKGGDFSRYYSDVHLTISWNQRRGTYHGFLGSKHRPLEKPASADLFLRPGLTWSRRTNLPLSVRAMPAGCNFAQKGPAIFYDEDNSVGLLSTLAILNSSAFFYFIDFLCAAVGKSRAYDMGLLQKAPFPDLPQDRENELAELALRGWSLKRQLDTIKECSHAFLLPEKLANVVTGFQQAKILEGIDAVQLQIDTLSVRLFGLDPADLVSRLPTSAGIVQDESESSDEEDSDVDEEESEVPIDSELGLLSWSIGVAFGRFDWRLATGERKAPPEPAPFDPLPAKSPGMLPDGAAPFHTNSGILVDDQGHPHDLPRLIEEVLTCVQADVPGDVRRWLQRDFFYLHLKQYSKSRRKAPIYWPLSTTSGSYTLWLYYPRLTSQTLYTAVNDFVEPKLKQVSRDTATLRDRGASRSREDEKAFEALHTLELELIELRDTLLQIAPTYRPNHDDGVQITAAPLWKLFRHKPWQKVLKDTWTQLEEGDYDWAHLAMAYWPDRVRKKCKTDKSLAIAHDLEHLYVEPAAQPKKARGRKKAGGDE